MWKTPHLNMKKLSSWYAFMIFQESWYSNMGFLDAQDVWHWSPQWILYHPKSSVDFDKIIPLRFWNWLQIDFIDLDNNGIFPVIEFQVEVSYKMYFLDLGINQDEGIWKVRWGKRLWLICLRWRADQANV